MDVAKTPTGTIAVSDEEELIEPPTKKNKPLSVAEYCDRGKSDTSSSAYVEKNPNPATGKFARGKENRLKRGKDKAGAQDDVTGGCIIHLDSQDTASSDKGASADPTEGAEENYEGALPRAAEPGPWQPVNPTEADETSDDNDGAAASPPKTPTPGTSLNVDDELNDDDEPNGFLDKVRCMAVTVASQLCF